MKNIVLILTLLSTVFSSAGQQKKWHDLEGYFQSAANKEMYVQFIARDSFLLAKLLWNGGKMHLLPDTGLSFVSREIDDGNPVHIRFLRDGSGTVNQVNVANNGVWTRTVNYKPQTKNEMAHTPDQLEKFIGLYQAREDTLRYVRLGVDSNTLTIHQLWDANVIDNFVPESMQSFFKKERPVFTLNFSIDQQGRVTQFVAFGRDTWIRIGKLNINPARFKAFEGKYQSKDDPDNQVQLIATDSGLIVKQLWDGKVISVGPLTNNYFYNGVKAYPVNIISDDQGKVTSILIFGMDIFNKVDK